MSNPKQTKLKTKAPKKVPRGFKKKWLYAYNFCIIRNASKSEARNFANATVKGALEAIKEFASLY